MRRTFKVGLSIGLAGIGAAAVGGYLYVTGYFLPEPVIILPPPPPPKMEQPVVTAPAQSGPTPVPLDVAPKETPPPAQPTVASSLPPELPKGVPNETPKESTPPVSPVVAKVTTDQRVAQVVEGFTPRFQSLQTQCEAQLDQLASRAIAEFKAGGGTPQAKAAVGAKYLPQGVKLQSTCERYFETLLSGLESELRMSSLPVAVMTEIRTLYEQRVREMKSILVKRAGL